MSLGIADLEKLKSVAQVAVLFKRGRLTIYNWIDKGLVVNGQRVKLAAHRIGGHRFVHEDAITAFLAATNPEAPVLPESPAAMAARGKREKAIAAAKIGGAA